MEYTNGVHEWNTRMEYTKRCRNGPTARPMAGGTARGAAEQLPELAELGVGHVAEQAHHCHTVKFTGLAQALGQLQASNRGISGQTTGGQLVSSGPTRWISRSRSIGC